MFAPALLLGIVGGVSGAMFTVLNLKISRLRWRLLSTIKTPLAQQFVRCLEPTIIMVSEDGCPLRADNDDNNNDNDNDNDNDNNNTHVIKHTSMYFTFIIIFVFNFGNIFHGLFSCFGLMRRV